MNKQKFLGKKKVLLKVYDELKNRDLLPVEIYINGEKKKVDKKDLDEFKENLQEEKFIISVCGQIKAGKSTLLNAMIFEDIVLPSSITPETAKLTLLKYSEKPKFIAYFYSKEEWKNLKNSDYKKYIDEFINNYTNEFGEILTPEEFIGKVDEVNDFSLLKDYVGAEGKYTLFVKYVELYYPSEFLKEAIIVDTPGINDPNPERSKITKEWIDKSDAVIFLTYAGRAFDKADKEFLETYLYSVPKDKIILAITKIDSTKDYKRITDFVKKAVSESLGEGWAEILFKDKEIYPLAPIYALYKKIAEKIEKEEINEEDLPEELIEDIEKQLYDRPNMEPWIHEIIDNAKKFIEDFKEGVFKHLIEKKGEAILEAHQKRILSIYNYHIIKAEEEIAKLEDEKSLLFKNQDEIKKEKEKLRIFNKKFEKIEKELSHLNEKTKDDSSIILHNNIKNVKNKLYKFIDQKDDIKEITNKLPLETKLYLENSIKEINEDFKVYIKNEFKSHFELIKTELYSVNEESLVSEYMLLKTSLFTINQKALIEQVKDIIKNLTSENLENLRVRKFLFFTDKETTKEKIKKHIDSFLDEVERVMENSEAIKRAFDIFIGNPIEEFNKDIRESIKDYKMKLDNIDQNQQNLKESLEKLNEEIKKLEREISKIESEKSEIEIKML